eukprot:6562594-Pyramimonas_sp.AAC.1
MEGARTLCDSKEVLSAEEEHEHWPDVDHEELDDRGFAEFPATEEAEEQTNPKAMKVSTEEQNAVGR